MERAKHLKKKREELMPMDPKRWWNFCMSEDEKKEIELFLFSNVYNI